MTAQLGRVIIGQQAVLKQVLIALFCQGHCILEGVPGLAKTLMISSMAQLLSLDFRRIQFTPDLMPSDITGTEILDEEEGTGRRMLRFVRGPIFGNIVLGDEINRTPPKTQAALLQAMQEYKVTSAGRDFPLQKPFLVLGTQNPIEQEGTYPLPEAQLDRFMFKILISDLIDDTNAIAGGLQHFRHDHHEVIVFHVLDDAEVTFPFERLTRFRDMEGAGTVVANPQTLRRRYLARFNGFVDTLKTVCLDRKVSYHAANTSQPYDELLAEFLDKRARLG